MLEIVYSFRLPAQPASCEPHGEGHVNRTYLVRLVNGEQYILQRVSRAAFHDIPGLMENIAAVTKFLAARTDDPRAAMRLVPATDGKDWYVDGEGEYWRMYAFIENSVCLQSPERPEDFYQSAVAFGSFQRMLRDFPAETLHETIPDFHNTPDRYRKFRAALEADAAGRAKDVRREIDFALAREKNASALQNLLRAGKLPLRVTHNDTKLNNVMLDVKTHKALCVIDLDTVMPGLAAYDFGDSIRFGASTASEDEKDLGKVSLDLDLYRTFTEGFVTACAGLTDAELDSLPLGAKLMTLECGVRFLTDYLEGDHYFAVARPEHNLDRARTQFKLVADMEQKWDAMCSIVQEAKQKTC